jgi:hypothetical protein
VIKAAAAPVCSAMALVTGGREARCHVIRVGCALVVLQVTRYAGRVGTGEVVVTVDMTLRTLQRQMGAGECKAGSGVVERPAPPVRCGVALFASLRESRGNVIWISRILVVSEVTGHANRVGAGELVVVVDVALRALQGQMRPGQRKAGRAVVEGRVCPRGRIVTLVAALREVRLDMVRVRRSLIIL